MTDPMLVSARDAAAGSLQPLPAQIDAVADKAAALLRLQRTPAADRRVAMLVYNYPPGEANFGASFLNVPRSASSMLAAMKSAGYRTELPGADALIAQDAGDDEGLLPDGAGRRAAAVARQGPGRCDAAVALPRMVPVAAGGNAARIESYWGPPEKSTMLRPVAGEQAFVIPRVQLRQRRGAAPAAALRAWHQVADKAEQVYHRSAIPLSHGYLATYLWLRTRLRRERVVHVRHARHGRMVGGKETRAVGAGRSAASAGRPAQRLPVHHGQPRRGHHRQAPRARDHGEPFDADVRAGRLPPRRAGACTSACTTETLSPGPVKTAMEAQSHRPNSSEQHYDRDLNGRRLASVPTSPASSRCCIRTSTNWRRPRSRWAWRPSGRRRDASAAA